MTDRTLPHLFPSTDAEVFREHEPERWQRTSKILGATGYIVQRLTGAYVIDRDNAEGLAPLYDPATARWDPNACEQFGVPLQMLPEIHEATDVVGSVTPEAARHTGLAVGTPVICGSIRGVFVRTSATFRISFGSFPKSFSYA